MRTTIRSSGRCATPALEWEELFADSMAVCLPCDHELADEDEVAHEQLADEAFAAPYECVCRDALVQSCRDSGFTPHVVTETNDYPCAVDRPHSI